MQTAFLTALSFSGAVGGLEDDIVTPGPGDGMETLGLEEGIATTGVTGGLNEPTGKVPLVSVQGKGGWLQRQAVTCRGRMYTYI